jgi:hypothetical protein
VPGADEELRQVLGDMTQDTQHSGEVVCGLRMQLPNGLILAARVALAAPLSPQDRGQRFPNSQDCQNQIELS